MNDKEKYEMIAMCAQALADDNEVQFFEPSKGIWIDNCATLYQLVLNVFYYGYIYRVKPEPKTLSFRVALCRDKNGVFHTSTYESGYDASSSPEFVEWLMDLKTVELPE
jgi:hypothetical protein